MYTWNLKITGTTRYGLYLTDNSVLVTEETYSVRTPINMISRRRYNWKCWNTLRNLNISELYVLNERIVRMKTFSETLHGPECNGLRIREKLHKSGRCGEVTRWSCATRKSTDVGIHALSMRLFDSLSCIVSVGASGVWNLGGGRPKFS